MIGSDTRIPELSAPTLTPVHLDLDARRQSVRAFIGRQADVEQVLMELDNRLEAGAAIIVSISGVGGVGKTTLLRQILHQRRYPALYIFADDRDSLTDVPTAARLLATRMAVVAGPRSHTARALIGGAPVSHVPLLAAMSSGLDDEVARLTDAFIRDVNAAAGEGRQVVVVLDGYEGAREVLGPWLLDHLLGGRLTPVSGDLRLLISGREPLQRTHLRWLLEWGNHIINVELQPFTPSETEQFLKAAPGLASTSPAEVRDAYELTGGLPVWLALWRPHPGASASGRRMDLASAETVQAVVDRFLMWWDNPTHLRWVRATWIPRWFNQEILKVLLPDEAEAAFDWLTRQASIVVGERGRWRYHEVVRTALRREGLQRTPDALAADHDRLAAYWRERVAAEAVYHALLGTRPSDGVRLLTERYVRGLRSDEDPHAIVAAALVARAESAAPADLTAVDLVHAHWSAYRAGDRLAEQDARDRLLELDVLAAAERATLLAQVVEQTDTDPQQSTAIAARPARGGRWRFGRRKPPPAASARLTALVEYGDSLRAAGKHAEAVRVLDEALRISSDDPNARVGRGEALRALGRTSEAIQDLSVALKYAPDNVWAWTLRSAAYLACDQFERAHADAAQAVRREPRNPWALALRGLARCQVDRYPTPPAMLDLRRALELDPSITWARAALDDWEALVESAPPGADPDED